MTVLKLNDTALSAIKRAAKLAQWHGCPYVVTESLDVIADSPDNKQKILERCWP